MGAPEPATQLAIENLQVDELETHVSSDVDTSSSIDTSISYPDSVPESPAAKAHDIITDLLTLGRSLLDPVPLDRLNHPSHPDGGQFDYNHVKEKFPDAEAYLILRLGQANWNRRQGFRMLRPDDARNAVLSYSSREAHTDNGDDSESDNCDHDESDQSDSESEHESPKQDRGQTVNKFLAEQNRISRTESISNLSQSSVWSEEGAASIDSLMSSHPMTKSTAPTEVLTEYLELAPAKRVLSTRYKIPPPPGLNALSGDGFRCPYCAYFLLDIKTMAEWK